MNAELSRSTNAELVEQIHYEFDTAGDNLFTEAETLLKDDKTEVLSAKAGRLQSLGFGASKGVKKSDQYLQDRIAAKQNAKLINQYREDYPLNKFINEDSIKRICEKFGIVKGKVAWFIGEVPEKNLQEIENFKVKDEDSLWLRSSRWTDLSVRGFIPPMFLPEVLVDYNEHYAHEMNLQAKASQDLAAKRAKIGGIGGGLGYSRSLIGAMIDNDMFTVKLGDHSDSYSKAPLHIVAPITDFDTTEFDLEKTGYDLTQKVEDAPKFDLNWLLEDPIVLQPVKGGYLIVSAWGDEASDPDVVNEIMN